MTHVDVTNPPFTLTASLASIVPESQPVVLSLALHNGGTESRMIGGSAFEASSFQIIVTDGKGRPVARTAVGERVLTPPTSVYANATVIVGVGQTRRYRFSLARLFDLSRAGDYNVSVARTLVPWPFHVPAPTPGQPSPPTQTDLILRPLTVRMVDDPASVSGPTVAPPTAKQTILYMMSSEGPGVVRYRVGDDGGVSMAIGPDGLGSSSPGSAASRKTGPGTPAVTPDGRFLYCGNSDCTISQFRIGSDGVLAPLSPPTVPTSRGPGTLLMDPRGRFLHALPGGSFAIGADGHLTAIAASADASGAPGMCAIDSTGTRLYTCVGLTNGYQINDAGQLTASPTPATSASGLNSGRDNAFALSPSGRFAYVGVSTQSGSAFFDLVVPMKVAADGSLTPIPGAARVPQSPSYPPGFLPFQCNSLAVDPTGRFLVVVNSGYLDAFRIEADGTLTPLGMTLVRGDLDSVFFLPGHPIAYVHSRNPLSLLAFRLDEKRGLAPADVNMLEGAPYQVNAASAVIPACMRWGQAMGGLEVAAQLPADDVPAGRPIVLTVTLRNTTSRPLTLGLQGADMAAFRLSVTGPQRRSPGVRRGGWETATTEAPLLAVGHDLLGTSGVGGAPVVLPPGGERAYRLVLTRLLDMTVAGNYTVQVTRVLPDGEAASSPAVPMLLEGPFNGVSRVTNPLGVWQGLDVL